MIKKNKTFTSKKSETNSKPYSKTSERTNSKSRTYSKTNDRTESKPYSRSKDRSSSKPYSKTSERPESKTFSKYNDNSRTFSPRPPLSYKISADPLFSSKQIPKDSLEILNDFQTIVQSVRPLSAKQQLTLSREIMDLSHELTDARGERRVGYMNEKIYLSAYSRYFMWWNLIRLTRLFTTLDFSKLSLTDDSICLDIGSGPLTVVIALWLSRPELRNIKLTWYCLDISQAALSLGENLFMSVVARTQSSNSEDTTNNWKIIRVKGELGTNIKDKATLVTCANMFNEVYQNNNLPPDFLAKKYTGILLPYLNTTLPNSAILVIEPGVPKAARFISLMRDSFIRQNLTISSPCPHAETCPMDGRNIHKNTGSGCGKWCNFAFSTDDAPSKLLRLSKQASLPKERAVLSFVYAFKSASTTDTTTKDETTLLLRIASDAIRLPGDRAGFYACSEIGLVLVVPQNEVFNSGDLLKIKRPANLSGLIKDRKTGAPIITL